MKRGLLLWLGRLSGKSPGGGGRGSGGGGRGRAAWGGETVPGKKATNARRGEGGGGGGVQPAVFRCPYLRWDRGVGEKKITLSLDLRGPLLVSGAKALERVVV